MLETTIITWDIIQNNPDKSWDWHWLSLNPNITWHIVAKNPHIPWDWPFLSSNKFLEDYIALKNYHYKKNTEKQNRITTRILEKDKRLYRDILSIIKLYNKLY